MSYVLARKTTTDGKNEYFTSASSYSRAVWVGLDEAKKYETAELAQQAVKQLWKNGLFEAKVLPLAEAIGVTPDRQEQSAESVPANKKGKMIALKQKPLDTNKIKGLCPDCEKEPCECDDLNFADARHDPESLDYTYMKKEGLNHMGEREYQTYASWKAACKKAYPGCTFRGDKDIGGAVVDGKDVGEWGGDVGSVYKPVVKENTPFHMPAKPHNNPETPAHSTEFPKVDTIKIADHPDNGEKVEAPIAQAHEEKLAVPGELMSALTKVISEFKAESEKETEHDDTRGSFCMTVVSALEELATHLGKGTVEGMKQAQVHMTSLMNPITMHIPDELIKFIARGGAKRNLKDYFNDKWEVARKAS